MSKSGGLGQMIKGIFIGIVLILAVIGTMSMLDKDNNSSSNTSTSTASTEMPSTEQSVDTKPEIQAPDIKLAPATTAPPVVTTDSANTNQQNIPKLEGEKTAEEIKQIEAEKQAKAIKYGTIKLSSINPDNKENLKANFVVIDSKNNKVAETLNSSNASFHLPIGRYKVTTTLIKSLESTTRNSEAIQTSQIITVNADKIAKHIIELEPPSTIGVLQVSSTNSKTKQAMKANFIIQKENGETVATRQNVVRSLFKLKAGSYKVTVSSGNNSDFRTIVVEPGESVSEVFSLQESFLQGRVLVRVFDKKSSQPVLADIVISSMSGKIMQQLKSVSQTEIALAEGNYKIIVTGPKARSQKNVRVIAGQSVSEIFRFDAPPETQVTDNTRITAIEPEEAQPATDNAEPLTEPSLGRLKLSAQNNGDRKPLKSNFYIQTPNGQNIAKKIYADNAEFNLKPGKYKVTIRSKNRKNIVRNFEVFAGKSQSEIFTLFKPNTRNNASPVLAPPKPTKKPKTIPNGFLSVAMQPARNTHFIIANRAGKKIVELTSVPTGKFKLDTGVYSVTAIYNNQRRKKTIQVHQGKTTHLNFKRSDFQTKRVINKPQKGVLRSRIIDESGRPLRANLTVTNQRGQVVARANQVTVGIFDLPPVPHTIIVNYGGLSGNEKVNITAGKTTVQTFTISTNNNQQPQEQARDPRDILREKVEEELRRIF